MIWIMSMKFIAYCKHVVISACGMQGVNHGIIVQVDANFADFKI